MQVLLFEMKPRAGHEEHYFRHVDKLRPLLLKQEGLLFIDRFKSLSRAGVILSHSLWRDEAAIAKWRTDSEHHRSQAAGRTKHFEDYRIRISHALEAHESGKQPEQWSHSGSYRAATQNDSRLLVITASTGEAYHGSGEIFLSVNIDKSFLSVESASSTTQAQQMVATAKQNPAVSRVILSSVSRDYGMYDRSEAPQYFAPMSQSAKAD